ncbi:Monooxygenase [Exophiala dermatitidis]
MAKREQAVRLCKLILFHLSKHLILIGIQALRENFSLSTWLLLGALIQSIVVFVVPRLYATIPLILVLGARVVDAMAVTWGWKKNPMLDGALMHRVSPQIPDEDGTFHEDAAEEKVVVFLLGAKANHPLGIFSPNMNTISGFLTGMISNLDETATENGFYGGSNWTNQDKNGATEFLFLSYWRSTEDIHKYAYSPLHREAWDWWNKTIKQNDHIGINHEIFEVDRKHWEAIYVNFQPTLLGATTYLRKGDKMMGGTVDDQWISPLLDARTGKLRSSAGRLGRDPGQLYDKYELAPGATRQED